MSKVYRAAIFDIGGVLTVSPVTRIKNFCAAHAIADEVRYAIFAPEDGPWSRFERSELTPEGYVYWGNNAQIAKCDGQTAGIDGWVWVIHMGGSP